MRRLACIVAFFCCAWYAANGAWAQSFAPAVGSPLPIAQVQVALPTASATPTQSPLRPPALPDANTPWQSQSLPDHWRTTRPEHGGGLWYRLQLDGPDTLHAGSVAALYIERVCSNMAVYLNGTLVGTGGSLVEPYSRNCFTPQLVTLPQQLFLPTGNHLLIYVVGYPLRQVSAAQRSSGLSALRVGSLQSLQPLYDQALWWNISLPKIITAILAAFTLFIAAIWLARRKNTYYGYFALWIGWWTLNITRLYTIDPPIPGHWVEMLVPATAPICITGIVLFFMRFLGRNVRWVNYLAWGQLLVIPAIYLVIGRDYIYDTTRAVYGFLIVEFISVCVWYLWASWRQSRRDFWLFSIIILVLATITGIEFAAAFFGLQQTRHIGHLGGPVTLLPICLRLIWVFTDSLRRTEQLNAELEQRVAEKSAEIARNYAAMAEMGARTAAHQERQRIAADLHDDLGAKLLTMAQTSTRDTGERTAQMARQALDEMRLSVRGMTAEPSLAHEVLADWRAETMQRLDSAGIEATWTSDEPSADLVLPARLQVQLTRVLREAVSNVIRHSQAKRCELELQFVDNAVELRIADDGRGLAHVQADNPGHGLMNIERRARKLGGSHSFGQSRWGGALVCVQVPISGDSQPIPLT
jgi:two-component system, NarL family, sensor histidine kinase UhpB